MTKVTSYTYGAGSTGNPLLANDLLTITSPNAQPGGPDAGDSTVNVYDSLGRVTTQTDPMGFRTIFNYTSFNPATGNGTITITDPDGNTTVDDYVQGTLAAESKWTGSTLTSEQDYGPAHRGWGYQRRYPARRLDHRWRREPDQLQLRQCREHHLEHRPARARDHPGVHVPGSGQLRHHRRSIQQLLLRAHAGYPGRDDHPTVRRPAERDQLHAV